MDLENEVPDIVPVDCRLTRHNLDGFPDNELKDGTDQTLRAHLDTCPECSEELRLRLQLRNRLRETVARDRAPNGLRTVIRRRIREAAAGGAMRKGTA